MTDPVAFFLSAAYVTSVLAAVELLRRRQVATRRVLRALVHGAVAAWIVPTALLFHSAAWAALLPLVFAAVNLACWRTGRFRAFSQPGEQTVGIVFHPVAIAAVILVCWPEALRPIAVASVLVMGWADPLAALVGGGVRSPSFTPLGERKSVAGSLAMFSASLAVLAGVAWTKGQPHDWFTLLVGAAVATAAELFSARGSDNLSVTWGLAAALWLLGWGGAR
jgi:phytol kinase